MTIAITFAGCILFALIIAIVWTGMRRLIFPPHRRATQSPVDLGLSAESVAFDTHDGLTLRGWFIPAAQPRGTIVFCHGYTGDCSPDLIYAPDFHRAGYNLLLFDFRGHGASDGHLTSVVYLERRDLLAALDWLRARGIARVGLLGFSMGGAVALATAPHTEAVVGVISDSAFAELWRIVGHALVRRGMPAWCAMPLGWLILLCAGLRLRANLFSADPIHWIGRIAPRPVLLMHGEADDEVPVAEARRLFRAAREPKELWLVPGASHRQIETVARDEYRRRLIEFFDRVSFE